MSVSGNCRPRASSASRTGCSIATAAARSAPWRACRSTPGRCCAMSTPRVWRARVPGHPEGCAGGAGFHRPRPHGRHRHQRHGGPRTGQHRCARRAAGHGGEGVTLESLMQRADIVIATTGVKGLIRPQWVRKGQVILALSNPDPEIEPLVAHEQGAAFAADGKGINNLLAFPGLFKGALEARARRFSDAMLMAAADAIAALARGDELVPDPLDKALHEQVAAAVRAAAEPTAPD